MVLQGQQNHTKENHIGRIQRIKFKKRFTKGFIVSRSLMPMNWKKIPGVWDECTKN